MGLRVRGNNPCRGIAKNPRNQVTPTSTPAARRARVRPRSPLARGRRRDPAAGVNRLPLQRSAQFAVARYPRGRHQPSRFEDWPSRGPAGHIRADSQRGAIRSPRPRRARVSALRRGPGIHMALRHAGGRSARTRSSADYASTACATRQPAKPSWRADSCPWSASCSGTGGMPKQDPKGLGGPLDLTVAHRDEEVPGEEGTTRITVRRGMATREHEPATHPARCAQSLADCTRGGHPVNVLPDGPHRVWP